MLSSCWSTKLMQSRSENAKKRKSMEFHLCPFLLARGSGWSESDTSLCIATPL